MTRKPDGWVLLSGTNEILPHYFEDTKERCEARAFNDFQEYAGEQESFDCCVIPICLVPPALLDAIDEVQEAFQTYFDCVEREDKTEEEYLKSKLDKLKEVRG